MSAALQIALPDIGDYRDVPVIELLVKPGDRLAVDDLILSIESDKATMEVPSPVAGIVRELLVSVGTKVSEGTPILTVEPAEGGGVETAAAPPAAAAAPSASGQGAGPRSRAGEGQGEGSAPSGRGTPPSRRDGSLDLEASCPSPQPSPARERGRGADVSTGVVVLPNRCNTIGSGPGIAPLLSGARGSPRGAVSPGRTRGAPARRFRNPSEIEQKRSLAISGRVPVIGP